MTSQEFDIDVAMNMFAENKEIMDAAQCCAQLAANLGNARNAASFIREIAKEMAGEGFLVDQGGALAADEAWLRLLDTQHGLRWRMEVASLPEGYDEDGEAVTLACACAHMLHETAEMATTANLIRVAEQLVVHHGGEAGPDGVTPMLQLMVNLIGELEGRLLTLDVQETGKHADSAGLDRAEIAKHPMETNA